MWTHSSGDYITMRKMCERRIGSGKNTPRSSSFDINCEAEKKKIYQMMNLNGPNTIKPAAHKNAILKSYFRVFLDSFKAEMKGKAVEKELSMWHSPSHIKKVYGEQFLEWKVNLKAEHEQIVWHLNDIRPIRFWNFMFACQNKNKNCKWFCVLNFLLFSSSHIMWRQTRWRRGREEFYMIQWGNGKNLRVN